MSLLSVAFSLSFGAMFSKTWRVYKIFMAGKRFSLKKMVRAARYPGPQFEVSKFCLIFKFCRKTQPVNSSRVDCQTLPEYSFSVSQEVSQKESAPGANDRLL